MEALATSTFLVALAEIGDKTQLLALVLAARFQRPVPIILGILIATLANHALAALLGVWASGFFSPEVLRWLLAGSFIAMGLWILVPDKESEAGSMLRYGAFVTALVAFFFVEIGDKTQVATAVLGARFDQTALVVVGTTVGMLAANVPVVLAGNFAADRLPLSAIRCLAALLFIGLGVYAFFA